MLEGVPPPCSSGRMRCASPLHPEGWRRASAISGSGATTSSRASAARSRSALRRPGGAACPRSSPTRVVSTTPSTSAASWCRCSSTAPRAAPDVPEHRHDLRHRARPHRGRTLDRGIPARRRVDRRGASPVKCTWRAVNSNRVTRHVTIDSSRDSRRCARRRRSRLPRLPPAALGGTNAKVTIDGKSTGDWNKSGGVLPDGVDVDHRDPRKDEGFHSGLQHRRRGHRQVGRFPRLRGFHGDLLGPRRRGRGER